MTTHSNSKFFPIPTPTGISHLRHMVRISGIFCSSERSLRGKGNAGDQASNSMRIRWLRSIGAYASDSPCYDAISLLSKSQQEVRTVGRKSHLFGKAE